MIGLGTIINVAGILLGGLLGVLFGRLISPRHQDSLCKACGVCVLFLGIGGALEGMLAVSATGIESGRSLLIIASLALGALLGELINLEDGLERFGEWLKKKTGNGGDNRFTEGFVTASLTVCVGAMAIVGSIQDAMFGDYSILLTKAVLDLIIVMVLTSSLGQGCVFSALPVALLQGSVTALARLVAPLMTEAALGNLSLVGSILIFCVGVNLVWGKTVRVANFLPAVILAAAAAFLPFPL